ncbi:MAG: hypothetical protein Q4E06_09860 [Lautropia sp.]|nr:hypothetical protein [Lautropia sp.]
MNAGLPPSPLPAVDQETVDAVVNALQAAGSRLPIPAPDERLTDLLTSHQLLGADGIASCVDGPTLQALVATLASWRPDVACLLASAVMATLAELPPDHAVALHAWPQGGFWRLARPAAETPPRIWCWWWQGQVLQAPSTVFADTGLAMQECADHAASRLRPSPAAEQAQLAGLRQALRQGIGHAALQATEAHVRTRTMFHRRMIELPAIAWRMRQAHALLNSSGNPALRVELEQLQGGFGFMQESIGAQWLDWLYWADSLPATAGSTDIDSLNSSQSK